jgi:hypothetical protein
MDNRSTPGSVHVDALDAFLNARLADARSANEIRHWWAVKIRAKRIFAALAEDEIERVAAQLLRELRRGCDRTSAAA